MHTIEDFFDITNFFWIFPNFVDISKFCRCYIFLMVQIWQLDYISTLDAQHHQITLYFNTNTSIYSVTNSWLIYDIRSSQSNHTIEEVIRIFITSSLKSLPGDRNPSFNLYIMEHGLEIYFSWSDKLIFEVSIPANARFTGGTWRETPSSSMCEPLIFGKFTRRNVVSHIQMRTQKSYSLYMYLFDMITILALDLVWSWTENIYYIVCIYG